MNWFVRKQARRAARALERQRAYQDDKSRKNVGDLSLLERTVVGNATEVRARLERIRSLGPATRVLEVGSGAHGLVFFLGLAQAVGVDPLAGTYATQFPQWQRRARTVAAYGEALPFASGSFDLVLCDNVVDHAESPGRIVAEIARVLAPGGLLYFTVNVHHGIYALASAAHGCWNAVGLRYEIGPFADHTVHLTPRRAQRLFMRQPMRPLHQDIGIAAALAAAREQPARHVGDWLKRLFYKNARWELIAVRDGVAARAP
jgi:SAM-dependent methyltransferase